MAGFQRRNIILNQTAQTNDIDSVRTKHLLLMIAQSDIEENAGQQGDDENARSRSGKQFKAEMSLTKQPVSRAPKQR